MTARRADRTDPKAAPSSGAEPIDRAAAVLDAADDANDVIQFFEESAGAGGRWDYIERFDVADVRALGIEEFIRSHYGGGRYKAGIRARNSGTYGKSIVVSIAGARKSDHEREGVRSPGGPTPAAAAAPSSSGNNNPPSWIEKIILPIGVTMATAFGSLLAKKLLETPQTDPVLLELVKRSTRRESSGADVIDPIRLSQLVLEAEHRGELRGRELGNLVARVDGDAGGSGVGSAIRDALPLAHRMIDVAERKREAAEQPAGAARVDRPERVPASTSPDIVAAWLRPFMSYKHMLIRLADAGKDGTLYADVVIDNAPPDTIAAIHRADVDGRLETDLYDAIPELLQEPGRRTFAAELLESIRDAVRDIAQQDAAAAAAPVQGVKDA
ncbi:MAG: hypothetical protein ABJF01_17585 [bacterium]